jgi:predicted lipoprotein
MFQIMQAMVQKIACPQPLKESKKKNMKMKAAKYMIAIVLILVVAYNSVYFKKLDEVKASKAVTEFNAAQYAENFWNTKLLPNLNKAVSLNQLTTMLSTDPAKTFETYSHALGIGNLRYFLVRGKGTITSVNEDDITVQLQNDNTKKNITIATEYIFGNAVRDATGLVNINEFKKTMDFNNVSAEINKIIRAKVLPAFKANAKKGSTIEFVGAIELNKEHLDLSHIEVIPVEVQVL